MVLTSRQWQEVAPYLDEALALGKKERVNWLARFQKRNPEAGALLQMLLYEHGILEQEEFLEENQRLRLNPLRLTGRTIGPYTLISEIGHGGMGSVWKAERSSGGFAQLYALKLLRVVFLGRDGEERFKREGRILRRLAHPHIAKLVDTGVSASGQPYLVLEYVDGDHIDRHCDRRELDLRTRLRLFLDVLSAIGHAHSNGIVHSDIKPSNVLVGNDGRVKLLDFGIAKLLEDDMEERASRLVMMDSEQAMTPGYAAPEQLLGGTVTTRTDIYALGVLLCILITGKHPSAQRSLCGDLDAIVAKALKQDPDERYPSVDALADDLGLFLRTKRIGAGDPDSAKKI